MSEPTETSTRSLALTIKQEQHQADTTINPPSPSDSKHPKSSQSSDDCSQTSAPMSPHPRLGTTTKTPSGPHVGSSRPRPQSTTRPTKMLSQAQSVHYTRTGRVSKAKKGLKVHNCECGRAYTRAEHLRRHQKNHAQEDALSCDYANCSKVFYRPDLLQRHQERHNDPAQSSHQDGYNSAGSPGSSQFSAPTTVPASAATIASDPPHSTSLYASPRQHPSTITSSPKHNAQFASRSFAPVAMTVDGMSTSAGWGEQFGQSPAYSSSDDYASPHPGQGDYGNLFSNLSWSHSGSRTRTPSNASLHDPWGPYTPQSPSSSVSTMPYTCPPVPSLAYMTTSYPVSSYGILATSDPTADFEQFGSKTMMRRDMDEAGMLFQDQPYGMGQLAHTYPFEQYLNNYWRHFHPTFPVIHQPTFGSMEPSPMLYAAMIAIDGQYSNDTSTKHNARKLHDTCVKLLEKRKHESIAEPDRLCDYQAVFLIEVLSQYRARRAAKTLSPRFGTLYQKAAEECTRVSPELTSIVLSLEQPENVVFGNWMRWVERAVWQRLLTSCYVLESQQAMFLARESHESLFRQEGVDLPFPAHSLVWDATTLDDWAVAIQQHASSPQRVFEVTQVPVLVPCDPFQSSILIAVFYNRSEIASPYINAPVTEDIDHILDPSFTTKQRLLTAKLLQVTPIRALLAVSGESWILFEKVPSQQAQIIFKTTLRAWINQIWSAPEGASPTVSSKEAVQLAIQILHMALEEQPEDSELNMGSDMGVYFAALVLWAATTAGSSRKSVSRQVVHHMPYRHHSQPTSFINHESMLVSAKPHPLTSSFPLPNAGGMQMSLPSTMPSEPPSPTRHDSLSASTLLSYDQITFNTLSFLSAMPELVSPPHSSLDLDVLQSGCMSMLLWAKLQLRGTFLEGQTGMAMWAGAPEDSLGELLNSVVGSLERILNGGWTRWGI
ncbi:hypothetical protein HBI33_150250 [Parastagonospora nodorum]|nr:hypothetical protein HBI33_150250 [Parastagonospora nodorum]